MLALTKDGKAGFQKYTRNEDEDFASLVILKDTGGTFHRKCSEVSSVVSLQKLSIQIIASSFKSIIDETVQMILNSKSTGSEQEQDSEENENSEQEEEAIKQIFLSVLF